MGEFFNSCVVLQFRAGEGFSTTVDSHAYISSRKISCRKHAGVITRQKKKQQKNKNRTTEKYLFSHALIMCCLPGVLTHRMRSLQQTGFTLSIFLSALNSTSQSPAAKSFVRSMKTSVELCQTRQYGGLLC